MFGRQGCENCGACCRRLIIEATYLDVLRHPLIVRVAATMDGHGTIPPEEAKWLLNRQDAGRDRHHCLFLRADKRCGIYATRPNECVAFEPGSDQCCRARAEEGMLPLRPIHRLKALNVPPSFWAEPNSKYPAARVMRGRPATPEGG